MRPNGFNKIVVNGHRNIVWKKRGFECGRIVARARTKNIRFHRIGEGGGERVLMVLKFGVELMESPFAQLVVPFHEKRAERTLGQRFFAAGRIGQYAELHVHVGQLRKGVVVAVECGAAEREQSFLRFGEHMRFHAADLMQLDSPFRERRIGHELGELLVIDRLNLRNDERARLADPCQ